MAVKKSLVISGSNGIGLAISRVFADRGAGVHILDIAEPDRSIIAEDECEYSRFDMCCPDMDFIMRLAGDDSINTLIITAGIGRIAEYQNFTLNEIEKTLTINLLSSAKIIRVFYDKLLTLGGGKKDSIAA